VNLARSQRFPRTGIGKFGIGPQVQPSQECRTRSPAAKCFTARANLLDPADISWAGKLTVILVRPQFPSTIGYQSGKLRQVANANQQLVPASGRGSKHRTIAAVSLSSFLGSSKTLARMIGINVQESRNAGVYSRPARRWIDGCYDNASFNTDGKLCAE